MMKHGTGTGYSFMAAGVLMAASWLGGCGGLPGIGLSSGSTDSPSAPAAKAAMLTPEGICEGGGNASAAASANRGMEIALGIGECELVRLKGKPTDVLIGESGKGQRETQVLYSEPTGREIYLFTDNRLLRIIKPGQG